MVSRVACNDMAETGTISKKPMRPRRTVRERSTTHGRSLWARERVLGLDQLPFFRRTILIALELRRSHRDVFPLKDIQGHTLQEIAAILGISIETTRVRLMRASSRGDSDAMERA